MSEITTDLVRAAWQVQTRRSGAGRAAKIAEADAVFDAWLTEHDRQVLASRPDAPATATVTREAALRERVAAEIIDVRRTHSRIKGGCDSLLRRHVMGALHDAAVRVRDNAHADDEYPADWLAALGLTVTDTPTAAPSEMETGHPRIRLTRRPGWHATHPHAVDGECITGYAERTYDTRLTPTDEDEGADCG